MHRVIARLPLTLFALILLASASWAASDPQPPLLSGRDTIIYKEAFSAAKRGQWSSAHAMAARATNQLGAKILRWRDYSRAYSYAPFDEIAAFMENNPQWPRQAALAESAERSMVQEMSDETIRAWFRWRDPETRDGRLRYADILFASGDETRATSFVRKAWIEDEFSSKELRATYKHFKKYLRAEDHIARLDRLVWEHKTRSVKHMYRYVDEGHQHLAEARMALRRFAGGVDGAIARVPQSLRNDPGLLYERMHWRRRKGRDADALEILLQAPDTLGHGKRWWRERAIQIRESLQDGRISQAYQLAAGHKQIETGGFAEAEWLAGWLALRFLGEHRAAYRHFVRLHNAVLTPISRGRAAYWAGRAAEASDDPEGAMLWYAEAANFPGTYYGQLGAARLGAQDAPLVRSPDNRDGSAALTLEGHELVAAVRLLAYLNDDDMMRPFILRLSELARGRADHAYVSQVALSIDRPDLAIRAAKHATRDGYVSVERLFPVVALPFAMPDEHLEHALVLAVTRQESMFDTRARSGAGASGLMQLMPGTAKQVARQIRVSYAKESLTDDPEYNVSLGSNYLKYLIERFEGSYLLAIAGYNAGPANVGRWIRENGDPRYDANIDIIDWVELIPIPETRNYVQRVLEGVQIYRWRLNQKVSVGSLEQDLARGLAPSILTARCGRGGAAQKNADLNSVC